MLNYSITFENGCNLFINAETMFDAVGEGLNYLLNLLPKGYDRDSLVRPTIVSINGDYCRVCGVSLDEVEGIVNVQPEITKIGVKLCMCCARRVSDAYVGEDDE